MLQNINPIVFAGGLAVAVLGGILGALAIGRHFGRRTIAHSGDAGSAGAVSLEAAVFALLGLLIAFTFSGALTRFDLRRSQIVDEANAIGTAYLRVDLLAPSAQQKLRQTFRDYVDARIATYKRLPDIDAARGELARSQQLQADIWAQAVAAIRLPDSRPSAEVLLMPALNQMFDITTTRLAATQFHPPIIVYAMLVGLALASALLAGHQSAREKTLDWVHQLGFATIIAFTVYVILNIEYPRLGWVRLDHMDQLLVDVRAAMG
jgi:hypothetical protein